MSRSSSILRLKIQLLHTRFEIVRVVDLSSRMRLAEVHNLIQAVMPWNDGHVHQFFAGKRRLGLPSDEFEDAGISIRDERITTLGAALELAGAEPLIYAYDFGDGWEHALTIESVSAADPQTTYPLLIQAIGACPPDDVGGVAGYRQFVAAMADPNDPDHDRLRQWYGRDFDPDHVDIESIRLRLTNLKHRWTPDAI